MSDELVREEQVPNALSCPKYTEFNAPMVLVSVGAEKFIGGLLDLDEGLCTLGYPLRYGEFVRPGPNGMADASIDMAMEKVYMYISNMDEIRLAYSSIHVLRPSDPDSVKLVEIYEQSHERILKQDAGKIEVKEQNRIIIPGMEDVVRSNQLKVK